MKKEKNPTDTLVDIVKRAYRGLPSYRSGGRNWASSFAKAIAVMIMRSSHGKGGDRIDPPSQYVEDIAKRLDGLRDVQSRIVDARGENKEFHQIHDVGSLPDGDAPPFTQVDIGELDLPYSFIVRSDRLFNEIAFRGWLPADHDDRAVIVDCLRQDRTLHVVFYAVSACLAGVRRIEVDLDKGMIRTWPSGTDPHPYYSRFLQIMYMALPSRKPSDADGTGDVEPLPAEVGDAMSVLTGLPDGPLADMEASASIRHICMRHPVTKAVHEEAQPMIDREVLDAFDADVIGDDVPFSNRYFLWHMERTNPSLRAMYQKLPPERMIEVTTRLGEMATGQAGVWIGYLAGISRMLVAIEAASRSGRASFDVHATRRSRGNDPEIASHHCTSGIIVVKDRALFELASSGPLMAAKTRREVPLAVLYDLRDDAYLTMVIQMDGGTINLGDWRTVKVEGDDQDDALTWYLRDLIAVSDTVLTDCQVETPTVVAGTTGTTVPTPVTPIVEEEEIRLDLGDTDPVPAPVEVVRSPHAPYRPVARVKVTTESVVEAAAIIDRWFDARAIRLGQSVLSEQREAGTWRQEQRSDMTSTADLWSVTVEMVDGRIGIDVATTARGSFKARLPGLLRDLAEFPGIEGPDGRLEIGARTIVSRTELAGFMRLATDPERVLPIVLMTSTEEGRYVTDPDRLAVRLLGAAHVFTISSPLTSQLADAWGQGLSVRNGAARLYQTDFDPNVDSSYRHPVMVYGANAERQVERLVNRETESTLRRYDEKGRVTARMIGERVIPRPSEVVADPDADTDADGETNGSMDVDVVAEAFAAGEIETIDPVIGHEPTTGRVDGDRMRPETDGGHDDHAEHEVNLPIPVTDADADAVEKRNDEEDVRKGAPRRDGAPQEARRMPRQESRKARLDVGPDGLLDVLASILGRMDGMESKIDLLSRKGSYTSEGAEAEIDALRSELAAERNHSHELLSIAEEERDEAIAEREKLRKALSRMRASGQTTTSDGRPYPESLADLEPWVDEHLIGRVVILPRAYRAMRKVKYRDMERLCRTLALMSGPYIDMKQGVEGARETWEEGLRDLRLEIKKQSPMGASANEGEYYFRYQGEKLLLDRHIRGVERRHNDEAHLLRIYFHYHRDERTGEGRVLIGHLPTHLTTNDS